MYLLKNEPPGEKSPATWILNSWSFVNNHLSALGEPLVSSLPPPCSVIPHNVSWYSFEIHLCWALSGPFQLKKKNWDNFFYDFFNNSPFQFLCFLECLLVGGGASTTGPLIFFLLPFSISQHFILLPRKFPQFYFQSVLNLFYFSYSVASSSLSTVGHPLPPLSEKVNHSFLWSFLCSLHSFHFPLFILFYSSWSLSF